MKKNYNYARLDRGNFEYAPNIIHIGDRQIINASAEEYALLGWLPIVKTDMPESGDGYYFVPNYTETDGKILQSWEKVEYEPEATESDYINALEDLGVNFDE